ncbi:hypothetical protein TraAM80_08795 [Trypanosoma rangeli]|uniref:Uncharacterized protein n=1 Tax=Trypanosoma rangeli TaxID=5698 RepID=A0A3R7R9M2_TRYRA|nr:uncharacterized protein TraAM80_08795 [Trypanosoma rangeli]RNE98392.1 hypothetical protein TraAM80_08795 [Trypanosoma rangeli]|eukprot:RNE98392.1 hypothetical protein TraAM80_08795 [Trypanosoma rangeli]
MLKTDAPLSATKRRYAATVEKGENAWRREWSSFMSGVNMKEIRKGGGVVLPKSADLEVAESSSRGDGCSFSYLFASPAEKKATRLAKQRAEDEKRKERALQKAKHSDDPLAHLSKHERTLLEARKRGLKVEGMTRKEVRQFLHLTISKEQQEAERHQEEFRPHELMDEKLQWYQQGPHPIDLIAEKLVVRKASKKAKQLGLRYNYLMPHASWLAKREQRRRERLLVGLGQHYMFDEEGRMMDMFGNYVDKASSTGMPPDSNDKETALAKNTSEAQHYPLREPDRIVSAVMSAPIMCPDALVDPRKACNSYVRAVVRDRKVADAIRSANITTSYISSSLVMGPSIGLDDEEENPVVAQKHVKPTVPSRVKVRETRSKAASFEP